MLEYDQCDNDLNWSNRSNRALSMDESSQRDRGLEEMRQLQCMD